MSDSVLDRLRQNRQRAAVPLRSDTLITKTKLSAQVQVGQPAGPTLKESTRIASNGDTLEDLKAELAKIPETNRHSAIVLEKELDQQLTRYCKDNRITVEVFLESAWIHASSNSGAMEEILTEAKRRYSERKRAGQLRRLITMIEGKS